MFYFGVSAFVIFGTMYVACDSSAQINGFNGNYVVFNSLLNSNNVNNANLFSSQASATHLETPDLKIVQDNTVYGVSTPSIVSGKVLGDIFGGTSNTKKDIANYTVQLGDTVQSIASANNISVNTVLWANDLTSSSALKVGQNLTILPTDGILYPVKSGDTIGGIAQKYKAQQDDIIAFNNLSNQDDIYIGDVLIIPGGVLPKASPSPVINNQIPLADNFFIFPAQGRITQGLHYFNAIDIANSCGTPVYAAAAGVVQRAFSSGAWNGGMGNYITILHSNGTVTYYGHLQTLFVKSGETAYVGQNIGLVGRTGNATGCHVHFEVVGARNPLAKYPVGTDISYK